MAGLNDEMKRICAILRDHTIRCWLRMDVKEEGADIKESTSTSDASVGSSESGEGSDIKGRFLTSDQTDLMGSEWRLLRCVSE